MPDYPGFGRFGFVCYVQDYVRIVEGVVKADQHLRRVGRPFAADMLARAYSQLHAGLVALGDRHAVAGTATLRRIERSTRVRPDTGGQGGERLEDNLVVRAERTGVMPGSIGIADYDLLDMNVPWWVTNEVGSSARVGSTLYGTFYGGGGGPAAPDWSQFRQHPLFEPGKGSDAGLGIIRHPIPARHFIEKAIREIEPTWAAEFQSLRRAFETRLDTVAQTHR